MDPSLFRDTLLDSDLGALNLQHKHQSVINCVFWKSEEVRRRRGAPGLLGAVIACSHQEDRIDPIDHIDAVTFEKDSAGFTVGP